MQLKKLDKVELSLVEVLSKIIAYSYKKGYSFVFYRLPDSQLVEISLTKHVAPVDLEFIKEGKGADIRAFVVNGEVVGAMKRQATREDEFRSNLHRKY